MSTVTHDMAAGNGKMMDQVERLRESRQQLRAELGKVIVGQEDVIDQLLLGLLCQIYQLLKTRFLSCKILKLGLNLR